VWPGRVAPVNCNHFNFAAAFPASRAASFSYYYLPGEKHKEKPRARHGVHQYRILRVPIASDTTWNARENEQILITNINLAGSWLWNANARRRNVSAAACTLATFRERPQENRYFRAISISPYNDRMRRHDAQSEICSMCTTTETQNIPYDCFAIVFKILLVFRFGIKIFKNLKNLFILYKIN